MKRQIDKVGRISIPAEFRKELGMNVGDYVNIECENDGVIITNPKRDEKRQMIIDKLKECEVTEEIISMIESL